MADPTTVRAAIPFPVGTDQVGAGPAEMQALAQQVDNVIVLKYEATIGDGSSTSYTITHNLASQDVVVYVRTAAAPYSTVLCEIQQTTTNTVTVLFVTPPAANAYRVTVLC